MLDNDDLRNMRNNIPMDPLIKKTWLKHLMLWGCEKVNDFGLFVCQRIITKSSAEENLTEYCETSLVEAFHEIIDLLKENGAAQRLNKALEFTFSIIEKSLITKSGIVRVWQAMSEHIDDKYFVAPSLVKIIEKSSKHVKIFNDDGLRDKIASVKAALERNLKNLKLKKHHKDMKKTIKCLENLPNLQERSTSIVNVQQPSTETSCGSLKTSETSRKFSDSPCNIAEVDESFKVLVRKMHNKEFINMSLSLTNHVENAKYFVDNAARDEKTAESFSVILGTFDSEEFTETLVEYSEVKFRKQHSSLTRESFGYKEKCGTARFIAELLFKKMMPIAKVESLINFVDIQPRIPQISEVCKILLETAIEYFNGLEWLESIKSSEKRKPNE